MQQVSRSALVALTYNQIINKVSALQRQMGLTNKEVETAMFMAMNDVRTATAIDSANEVISLTQRIQELERKEAARDNSDTGT